MTTTAGHPVIAIRDITKVYGEGDTEVRALRGVSLDIGAGEYVAIMGASGSGKSTLMHIIGCLDVPTSGRYLLDGMDVSKLDDFALSVVRNRKIGFVFQSFNLIPRTSAFANVELPMVYANVPKAERQQRALAALEKVGLGDRGDALPEPALGRPAATRRDRARDRDESRDDPRRRADGCARQRVDRRGARAVRRAQRRGPHRGRDHPRARRRRARRPAHPAARRRR